MQTLKVGMNLDPHFTETANVDLLGVSWVRFPLWPDFDYNPFIGLCHTQNIEVWPVFDDVALSDIKPGETRPQFFARKAQEFPEVDRWQIMNEVDGQGGTESGPHIKSFVNQMLKAARAGMPNAYLIGPSLVSGNPGYCKGIRWDLVNALAPHPYGQWPTSDLPGEGWFGGVGDLIGLYRPIAERYGLDIICTEFGAVGDQFNDEHERAVYHSGMLVGMEEAGVSAAAVYCLLDAQRPQDGGMGCYDLDLNLKETGAAIVGATGS